LEQQKEKILNDKEEIELVKQVRPRPKSMRSSLRIKLQNLIFDTYNKIREKVKKEEEELAKA
jgi:hypothetical protein